MNQPPSNTEAEEALLGSILLDPDVLLAIQTTPDQFYVERNADIFYAMQSLLAEGNAIDFVTLCSKLESCKKLEQVGGAAYVSSLLNAVPSALNAAEYAALVEGRATDRKLLAAAGTLADLAYQAKGLTTEEKLSRAHNAVMQVDAVGCAGNGTAFGDAVVGFLPELYEYLDGKRETWGVPTGIHDLDAYIGGLAYGEMTLIAADPGKGKTTLAMTIAINAAMKGHAGAVFSLEMKTRQLMLRFFAERGDVDTSAIRRGKITPAQKERMIDKVTEAESLPLTIFDEPKDTATVLRDTMRLQRRLESQGKKLDFIVVDYSDLLKDHAESEVVRNKVLSHNLKNIAKQTGAASVVVHTINRDGSEDEPPSLRNLGWGRAWEFDAHTVLFPHFKKGRTDNTAVIKVGKYRDGVAERAIDTSFDGKRWADLVKTPERAPNWSAGGGR